MKRKLRVGGRYRLSQVGTVREFHDVDEKVVYITKDGESRLLAVSRELFEWEELEPVYEPGAYYVDAIGDVYRRRADGTDNYPWRGGDTHWEAEVPRRPLRKLDQSCWPEAGL